MQQATEHSLSLSDGTVPPDETSAVVARLSLDAARVVSDALSVVTSLDELDEQLLTIVILWEPELHVISSDFHDLLSKAWTVLGGNKGDRQRLSYRADVLRHLDEYRSISNAQIAATGEALLQVIVDLSELCRQFHVLQVAGGKLPVKVLARSVERGTKWLYDRLGVSDSDSNDDM